MTREELLYVLLFSLPVGLGVSLGTMRMTGGGFGHPLVLGSGVVTAVVLFLAMVVLVSTGEPDEDLRS